MEKKEETGAKLLKVLTGRQPVPILTGTQSLGYPMSKPAFKKKKKRDSCVLSLALWLQLNKKGLPWRHVHNV